MKKAIITELIPTGSQKSFYGKAKVIDDGDRCNLLSYATIVGGVDKNGIVHRYSDWRTATTSKHVKSFLETVGAEITTKEFWSLGVEKMPDIKLCQTC